MQSYYDFEYTVESKQASLRAAVERARLSGGPARASRARSGLAHVLAVALRGLADRLEAPARITA